MRNSDHQLPAATTHVGPISVIAVPLASSVICGVTQSCNQAWVDLDETWFVAANFMAAELHGLIGRVAYRRPKRGE